MRNILLPAFCVAAVAACGADGGTTLPELTTQTARIAFVSGSAQEDTVAQQLPNALTVRVTDDGGRPRSGVLVNFVVVEPGCGRAFAGSAQTDDAGEARERWELGTKAGTCHMEARAVDQKTGAALVFDRVEARALADRPDTVRFLRTSPTLRSGGAHAIPLFLGENAALSMVQLRAADRFGNEIAAPSLTWQAQAPLQVANGQLSASTEGLFRASPAGSAITDTLYALALHDLRKTRWTAEWTCYDGFLRVQTSSGNSTVSVDSMRNTLELDSVQYTGAMEAEGGSRPLVGSRVRLWGTLGFTIWWRDGKVQTNNTTSPYSLFAFGGLAAPVRNQAFEGWQTPGTLHTVSARDTSATTTSRRTANGGYAGGASWWCSDGLGRTRSNFTLTPRS